MVRELGLGNVEVTIKMSQFLNNNIYISFNFVSINCKLTLREV